MDLQLKGRKALVTGASKGIGFQIAQTLLEEGVDVGICARNPDGVKQALGKLQAKGRAIGAPVDVTDTERYVSWIDSAAKELGGLDIFVHNVTAAPATPGLPGWELGYQTDIMGAVRGVEAALPHLRKSKPASIIMIASISGVMSKVLPAPGAYPYGACKAALIAYGAMISKDLAKEGIRVNMISPGPIYFEGGPWDRIKAKVPQMFTATEAACVVGRLGHPQDIADAAVFLASPRSSFTVGQNLHVDGGYMQHIPF